jgi:hypothetical protein
MGRSPATRCSLLGALGHLDASTLCTPVSAPITTGKDRDIGSMSMMPRACVRYSPARQARMTED